MMDEERRAVVECVPSDWTSSWQHLATIWGLPVALMVASAILAPRPRGAVWTALLLFMGGACLVNARRCHRTHCYYTSPFLILMAAVVALYTLGFVPLGSNGWGTLASVTFGGVAILCCVTERIRGRYLR
jgi:1,4-dihydroxy-2-naphthoate octaprenyltransferase